MPKFSEYSPGDGKDYDCQCARCGSSGDYEDCDSCEDGFDGHECGEDVCCCRYPEQNVPCDICRGHGGWWRCVSSPEWCNANPLPGREDVSRGEFEWFEIQERDNA